MICKRRIRLSASGRRMIGLRLRRRLAALEDLSDEELTALARGGERQSVEVLVRRHRGIAVKAASRIALPNTIDRDDLIQAGLMAIARSAVKWNPGAGSKFSTYAHGAVRKEVWHEYQQQLRSVGVQKHQEDGDDDPMGEVPAPADPDEDEGADSAPGVFAQVQEIGRIVLEMRFGRHMTRNETAATLGMTPLQVQRIEVQAVKTLRDLLPPR